jgi:integrase
LLGLRVGQVDLLERWIELHEYETKNDRSRKVFMTEEVFELMRECCRVKAKSDYVFTRADGSRVCDMRDAWYSLSVSSGLGRWVPVKRDNGEEYNRYVGLNPHDFRRSAIRNLVRAGVSERVCMDIS